MTLKEIVLSNPTAFVVIDRWSLQLLAVAASYEEAAILAGEIARRNRVGTAVVQAVSL